MSKTTLAAGTSPFAHLLAGAAALGGRALGRRPAAEEEDPAPDEGEVDPDEIVDDSDNDVDDVRDPDESEEGKRGRRGKRGKKAEDEDKDKKDEEDDDAEARAEDDDDDEEMAQARREGFLAAQARGRRIFSSASAGARPDMAAHLAFNDTMPSAQAIGMLDMAAGGGAPAAPGGSRLGRRMARVVIPNPGTGGRGARSSEEMSFGEMAKKAGEKAGIL